VTHFSGGMFVIVRRTALFLLGLLAWSCGGCASTAPPPAPKPAVREATPEERERIGRLVVPMLITAEIWAGRADGCAAALGILSAPAINLSVGPNTRCKFSLLITEGALATLSDDELRAGLAHEIGHVQLGHFAARKQRRVAEKKARAEVSDKTDTAGATVTAIPIVGPILAIGVAGSQIAAEASMDAEYRAYDREEEMAADRFGLDLLQLVIGRERACQAQIALLDRLVHARAARPWSAWVSTHPKPSDRLQETRDLCPC